MENDPGAVWREGVLISARFDDVYASRQGGLAQAQAVFLAGCDLPQAWAGRRHFTVAELGFGTGLNMLALLQLWQQHRPADGRLHMFSIEGFPLARGDVENALALFPELGGLAQPLLTNWPNGARGLHRICWPELGATLDLMIADVSAALADWDGKANAWFLDGFSPAKNPEMWDEAILRRVGELTAPGGRVATWSVAGAVRRGLQSAGFEIRRMPGFGYKAQRLEAEFPGKPDPQPCPEIAIIGGGIAGAALARAFRDRGANPRIFAHGPMASGNPAALITPRLVAGSHDGARLHSWAFRHAVDQIRQSAPEAVIAQGVRRLLSKSEAPRAEASIQSGLFPDGSLWMTDDAVMWMADALVISPQRLRSAWLGTTPEDREITGLHRKDGWWLETMTGAEGPFDHVIVAAGIQSAALADVQLRPVRGQCSMADIRPEGVPVSWGGYLIPTDSGLLFGATHDRGDADWDERDADGKRNLDGLARHFPELAEKLAGAALSHRAGVRAATGDHQPIAGEIAPGLSVLSGLGGRGFVLAPLLAEHVAAKVMGLASPLPLSLQRLVAPARGRSAIGRKANPSAGEHARA